MFSLSSNIVRYCRFYVILFHPRSQPLLEIGVETASVKISYEIFCCFSVNLTSLNHVCIWISIKSSQQVIATLTSKLLAF